MAKKARATFQKQETLQVKIEGSDRLSFMRDMTAMAPGRLDGQPRLKR